MSITTSFSYCKWNAFEDAWMPHEDETPDKEVSPPPTVEFRLEFRLGKRVQLVCQSEEGDETLFDTQEASTTMWFTVDRRRLISETTSRWVISRMLSQVNVPLEFQEMMIQRISSLAFDMANADSNRGRKMLRMVVSIELIKVVELNVDEANLRAAVESMNDGEFQAVPATKSSIEALEKVKIEDSGGSISWCTICLEDLSIGSEATCMPCSHVYHDGCIVHWLEKSNLCPLCRFQMPS